jgi:hypothetical protein
MDHETRYFGEIKPTPRKKGPIKKPPDKPLPLPDSVG